MTSQELPLRAASIKQAVGSAATCDASTVELLTKLLTPRLESDPSSIMPTKTLKGPKYMATTSRTTAPKETKSKRGTKVTILEVDEKEEILLRPHERYVLATETVNATLKALAEALKPVQAIHQSTKPVNKMTPGPKPVSKSAINRNTKPLQPRCVNRMSTSSDEIACSRRASSAISTGPAPGVIAQAECARLAFAALRSMKAQKNLGIEMPYLQLESGMSVLIGKLIALGLDDLAVKELRLLKRRLDTFSQSPKGELTVGQVKIGAGQKAIAVEKETLADLLNFVGDSSNEKVLRLIITTQLQILKLLAFKRRPSMIEVALKHVQLSERHAPANLIIHLVTSDEPLSSAKAAQQLESLAQSLLSLCPSVSSADDEPASNPKRSVSPEVALELQLTAFEIRIRWWQLSTHRYDVGKELLEPLARCLAAFRRRCTLAVEDQYRIAELAFDRVKTSLTMKTGSEHASFGSIYKLLAELGQESRRLDDAIKWHKKFTADLASIGGSKAQACASLCRIASISLQSMNATTSMQDTLAILKEAAEGLDGDVRGDAGELDDLLVAVAGARKSATLIWQESLKSAASRKDSTSTPLMEQCSELLLLCPKFLVRYIGNVPDPAENEKILSRYEQRRKVAGKVFKPTIDSVMVVAQFSVAVDSFRWERVSVALQDCARLALALDGDAPEVFLATSNAEPQQSALRALSNVYWRRYLHLKQADGRGGEIQQCLRVSADLIKNRGLIERNSGFLSIKLEKLGASYEASGNLIKACGAYAEALQEQIDAGLLRVAAEYAITKSPSEIFEADGEFAMFERILSAYLKTALGVNENEIHSRIPFNGHVMSDTERGLLLERHLTMFNSFLSAQGPSEQLCEAVRVTSKTILSVYTKEMYPIRRLRATVQLLRLNFGHPTVLDAVLIDSILHEDGNILKLTTANADAGLQNLTAHLTASRTACLAFSLENPTMQSFKPALDNWSKLVQGFRDWEMIRQHIGNISDWLLHLSSIADYLELQGHGTSTICVLHIIAMVHELQEPVQASTLVSDLSALGLQYMRLGYSAKAGLTLNKAQRFVEAANIAAPVVLQWLMAYAEYLLCIGNLSKCDEYLEKARALVMDNEWFNRPANTTLGKRSKLVRIYADASHVYSLLASARGCVPEALLHARHSVQLNYRAWATMEATGKQPASRKVTTCPVDVMESDVETNSLSAGSCEETGGTAIMSTTHCSLNSASFWTLVPRLFEALLNLSRLFDHQGKVQEAEHYVEQARKIASAVSASRLIGQCLAVAGDYQIRRGEVEQGLSLLQKATGIVFGAQQDRHYATLQCVISNAHALRCDWRSADGALSKAKHTLEELMAPSFIRTLNCLASPDLVLESQMSSLSLKDSPPINDLQRKRRVPTKSSSVKKSIEQKVIKGQAETRSVTECFPLLRFQRKIMGQQSSIAIRQKDLASAALLLSESATLPGDQQDMVLQELRAAEILLCQGVEQMSADAVFCVLPDSTISHPATTFGERAGNKQLPESHLGGAIPTLNSRRSPAKSSSRRTARTQDPQCRDFVDMLKQARDTICTVRPMATVTSSTAVIHNLSDIVGKTVMMLTAACPIEAKGQANSTFAVYCMELGRTIGMIRERAAVRVEKELCSKRELLTWPTSTPSAPESSGIDTPVDFAAFQRDYIDIIPPSWTVISISLNNSREELRISKIRSGQSPFILTLPLSRHNSRDADEEVFGFDQGRAELLDIIGLANYSAQDARNITHKNDRIDWWEARTALDARLKDLLVNMENIWLGGFRGIFSQQAQAPDLLSRFQQSFHNILEKHLPSRRRSSKVAKATRVSLDPRVLGLFVGLGDPNGTEDLDEPLNDLLYFVIDILQFQGERNAYDEIEFDSIAIETIDALKHYHEALKDNHRSRTGEHTILVLDKALHCFPWESLPCLTGHAVSRLPSLGDLRVRILQQRQQLQTGREHDINGFCVSKERGAYVLNPAGDLTATQAEFERPLESLQAWTSIVQREPDEVEMKACLENQDLFLYFGHGSGSHYIRARTIKKLEKCAVALLMGCSSGALTEAGEFEPYGTPLNYMQAGCPALVATLWDVTDKDIDRFSHSVLESWGLFGKTQPKKPSSPVKRSAKQKGKSRVEDAEMPDAVKSSLDQAVARGRESCILRYLNGAAPVVYGIPVFLS